jgi:uncharacterized membrane protein YgcG
VSLSFFNFIFKYCIVAPFSHMGLFTNSQGFHCQMLTASAPFSLSLPLNQCVVPQGLNGAVAIFITSDDQPLNGGVIDRQSNAIVAGPLLTFIDIEEDDISVLVRNKGGSSNSSSSGSGYGSSSSNSTSSNPGGASSFVSTTTVSPSDAGAILASATPSAAPDNVIANGVSMIPKPTSSS